MCVSVSTFEHPSPHSKKKCFLQLGYEQYVSASALFQSAYVKCFIIVAWFCPCVDGCTQVLLTVITAPMTRNDEKKCEKNNMCFRDVNIFHMTRARSQPNPCQKQKPLFADLTNFITSWTKLKITCSSRCFSRFICRCFGGWISSEQGFDLKIKQRLSACRSRTSCVVVLGDIRLKCSPRSGRAPAIPPIYSHK